MRKRAWLLLLAALLLTGCRVHSRWDVEDYLQELYPGERVVVSRRYREISHGTKVTRTWACISPTRTLIDLKPLTTVPAPWDGASAALSILPSSRARWNPRLRLEGGIQYASKAR